ncbi:MAG: hemerythrin domain-containing protein [Candidimonas sp.]|nr:MAG: hemerythrin domain-containing protein [Candidimonas sp.]
MQYRIGIEESEIGNSEYIGILSSSKYENLARYFHPWHAPRFDRSMQITIPGGTLIIETLDFSRIAAYSLCAGDDLWIGSGVRWRIRPGENNVTPTVKLYRMSYDPLQPPDSRRSRAHWFGSIPRISVGTRQQMAAALRSMRLDDPTLVGGPADIVQSLLDSDDSTFLYWHPLLIDNDGVVLVVIKASRPIDIDTYLSRDHALIEALLIRAVHDGGEALVWLRFVLGRHLDIEENYLFPKWVEVGGDEKEVPKLLRDHHFIRDYLDHFDSPDFKAHIFFNLLDGHDEKEERSVYSKIKDVERSAGTSGEAIRDISRLSVKMC